MINRYFHGIKFIFIIICAVGWDSGIEAQQKWYKGNTHAHTTYSDGYMTFNQVITQYFNKQYDFLAITDHNKVLDISKEYFNEKIMVIPGEEITFRNHIVGLGITKLIIPRLQSLPLQEVVDGINKNNGIPILAHPNDSSKWVDKMSLSEMKKLKNVHHIEVFYDNQWNKHFDIWDLLLTAGERYYGITSDDSHWESMIGKSWIMVNADRLTNESILSSIKNGDYYCSNGVSIKSINITKDYIEINCEGDNVNYKYIEQYGKIRYEENKSNWSRYYFKGDEKYIRVELTNALGQKAWTNPVFLETGIISDSQSYYTKKKNIFSIYPNPSNSIFNILLEDEFTEIALFDLIGREIKQSKYKINKLSKNSFQIDLLNNSSKVYLLKVNAGNKINTAKLILLK